MTVKSVNSNRPIVRGCGYRVAGGTYAEANGDALDKPISSFILDAPVAFKAPSKRGMHIYEKNGIPHLIDHVGLEYPNISDFIEEAVQHGVSRRIMPSLVKKLTKDSRLLFVHSRAIIENANELNPLVPDTDYARSCCAFHKRSGDLNHFDPTSDESCVRLHWGLAPKSHERNGLPFRQFTLDTEYQVIEKHPNMPAPKYASGLFMSIPISSITVIEAENMSHLSVIDDLQSIDLALNLSKF